MRSTLAREVWSRALNTHLRAAEAHDAAARLLARIRDPRAVIASQLAAEERKRHADALARHPDWAQDLGPAGAVSRSRVATADGRSARVPGTDRRSPYGGGDRARGPAAGPGADALIRAAVR